ncbi:response regulator [Sphingobium amiense]|uniref:Response regulator n=1 Tax=Sphingobium amiense TaxID=135719 RepID=A0A494W8K2_9SPHN|nr:response regulator [Sphingobium amiense]BBD96970.1 response regulator [Sphingobium amiense]
MSGILTVCVVDDDPSVRNALVNLIASMGFRGCGYHSAEAALRSGDVLAAACILTDIHMPELDGFALKRRLDELGSDTPVIMMTGRDDAHLERRAIEAGAMCLLRKPLHADALARCLAEAFGLG